MKNNKSLQNNFELLQKELREMSQALVKRILFNICEKFEQKFWWKRKTSQPKFCNFFEEFFLKISFSLEHFLKYAENGHCFQLISENMLWSTKNDKNWLRCFTFSSELLFWFLSNNGKKVFCPYLGHFSKNVLYKIKNNFEGLVVF